MDAVVENFDTLWHGFAVTLALFGIGGVGALALGLFVAALRVSPIPPLRAVATTYTEAFRNTPLTLVLFGCAFVLPYLGVELPYFVLACIGLIAYTAPFVAEAVRSGINGIPPGQAEAGRAIGLPFAQVLLLIIVPQAVRMVIPPIINVLIGLAKNTSVAGAFFVIELIASSRRVINLRGDAVIEILLAVAALYLVITVGLGLLSQFVERKVAVLR